MRDQFLTRDGHDGLLGEITGDSLEVMEVVVVAAVDGDLVMTLLHRIQDLNRRSMRNHDLRDGDLDFGAVLQLVQQEDIWPGRLIREGETGIGAAVGSEAITITIITVVARHPCLEAGVVTHLQDLQVALQLKALGLAQHADVELVYFGKEFTAGKK